MAKKPRDHAEPRQDVSLSVELIEGGADFAGAAAGAAVGLIGGPPGVLAGAGTGVLLTRVLRRVGAELQQRILGPRQHVRAGAAFAFAAEEIKRRMDEGEKPAEDFIAGDDGRRPEAEEVLEGVLLAAADAWEERKVRHLGLLYAWLAFKSFRPDYAHYLVSLADRLSYRQLVVLAELHASERKVRQYDFFGGQPEPSAMVHYDDGLEAELDELSQYGLIGQVAVHGGIRRLPQRYPFRDLKAWQIALTSTGQQLVEAMQLDTIEKKTRAEVRAALRGKVQDSALEQDAKSRRGIE